MITSPAFRDERHFRDVILGKRKAVQENLTENGKLGVAGSSGIANKKWKGVKKRWEVVGSKNGSMNVRSVKEAENNNQVSLIIQKNPVMIERMDLAAIVDLDKPFDTEKLELLNLECVDGADYISAITPFKIAIFFKNESALKLALEDNSTLRRLFPEARRWSDLEWEMERVTWIECYGIHPLCWGLENFKKLGNLWGEVLELDYVVDGVHCLTAAKILIRTKKLEKIDESIKVVWEGGSNVVRVFETVHGTKPSKQSLECVDDDDDCDETQPVTDNLERLPLDDVVVNEARENGEETHVVHSLVETNKVDDMDMAPVVNLQLGEGCGEVIAQNEEAGIMIIMDSFYVENMEVQDALSDQGRERFDPICEVECIIHSTDCVGENGRPSQVPVDSFTTNSVPQKRPRGRPKRACHSLPEPIGVPATPSSSNMEAHQTWNTGKRAGVQARNENAVISALRRSKRVLIMETHNP